jgi:hypothetical protein
MKLPRAILFDLDDTILVAFGPAQSQWQRTIAALAHQLGPIEATVIAAAIEAASTELWADAAQHKYWRHRTGAARRRIVATAFAALAVAGHPCPLRRSVTHLADAYNALHDEELSLFPDAHETLDRLEELGIKLALITNGAAEPQRAKVVSVSPSNTASTTSRSRASTASASPRSEPILMRWKRSASGRTRPGWSATILNGKSSHPNGSAFTRSGTTVTASGCPATLRSGQTASSAACRNWCCSRASWCASPKKPLVPRTLHRMSDIGPEAILLGYSVFALGMALPAPFRPLLNPVARAPAALKNPEISWRRPAINESMDADTETPAGVAFGRFRVLPHRCELLADGRPIKLGGRAFDVPKALIEVRGEVAGKDALMARVWPDWMV